MWVYVLAFLVGGVIVLGAGYFLIGETQGEAARLLLQAESLSQTGQLAEAKTLYRDILQKYPQTAEAGAAKNKLKILASAGRDKNFNNANLESWVAEKLTAAHSAIENGDLLFPASKSALFYINQVMTFMPDHQEARSLKAHIYRHYNDLANTAIQRQNLDSAMIYLYYLQLIDPENAASLEKSRVILQQQFISPKQ
jgi:tetratricopeptide (TPR) repeat protein